MQFLFLAIFAAVAAGHPTHHRHYYKSSDDSDLVASPSPDPSLPDIPDTGPLPDIPAGFGPTTDPSIADPTMAGNDGQFSEKSVQVAIKDAVTDVKKSIFASAALDLDADKVKDSAAISALEADAEVKMRTLTKDMVALEVEIMKSKNTAELFKKTSSITIAKEEKKLAEKKAEYKKDRKETLAKIAQNDSVTKSKQDALLPQGAGHEGPAQAAHRGDRGEEVRCCAVGVHRGCRQDCAPHGARGEEEGPGREEGRRQRRVPQGRQHVVRQRGVHQHARGPAQDDQLHPAPVNWGIFPRSRILQFYGGISDTWGGLSLSMGESVVGMRAIWRART